jgi:hypothetical protein
VLHWILQSLLDLPKDVQEKLSSKSGENIILNGILQRPAFDEVALEWANGLNGAHTYKEEGRGLNYLYFFPNLGLEWHDMARKFHRYDEDGNETGFRDLRFHQLAHRRKIFIDERGSFGWVSDQAKTGDVLCVLLGCNVPILLRQDGQEEYTFIGEAYVHQLMEGQAIDALERDEVKLQQFNLV